MHKQAKGTPSRTPPGVLSMRGCAFAGCKGLVLGPTRDIIHLVHGPIGCAYYTWLTKRYQARPARPEDPNYLPYAFSTDLQEADIIFGGEKKLKMAIEEAIALFNPRALAIFATCPVGLIGDDIHAVAREMEARHPGVRIFAFACEGYKGLTQTSGQHIANRTLFPEVVGKGETRKPGRFRVNLLDEYNLGGDAFELERIFSRCGLTLQAVFSGNATYDDLASAHAANLNLVMGHATSHDMAEKLEGAFGIPWFSASFIGCAATLRSLRRLADHFADPALTARIEAVIAEEMPAILAAQARHRPRCQGRAALFLQEGGRADDFRELFRELGMETLQMDPLESRDPWIIDGFDHRALARRIRDERPALLCADSKERFVLQKYGLPLKQLSSPDQGGPYAGFRGALAFYPEIERLVNALPWRLIRPPWQAAEAKAILPGGRSSQLE